MTKIQSSQVRGKRIGYNKYIWHNDIFKFIIYYGKEHCIENNIDNISILTNSYIF